MRCSLAAVAIALTACTPFAVAPPIRTVPLETSETVGEGRVGVAGSFGGHQLDLYAGTARVRYGLIDEVDLSLEGALMYFGMLEDRRSASELAGSVRVGVKHRVVPHLAFAGGIGGGAGPWGGFIGPDVGAIFAYENRWAVPFFALRGQLSLPIGIDPEEVLEDDGMGGTTTRIVEPYPTAYLQVSLGLRVPLCHDDCDGAQIALAAAAHYTLVYVAPPTDFGVGLLGGEGGIEVEF